MEDLKSLLDIFSSLRSASDGKEEINKIGSFLNEDKPEQVLGAISNYPRSFVARMSYVRYIGYALINQESINSIADFLGDSKTIEIGAGSGFLTYLLKYCRGVDIIATDSKTEMHPDWFKFQECQVFNTETDKLQDKYPDVTALVISWPKAYLRDLMDNLPDTITKLVIIGEYEEGCTDCLYTTKKCDKVKVYEYIPPSLSDKYNNKKQTYPFKSINHDTELPKFVGLNDALFMYERV